MGTQVQLITYMMDKHGMDFSAMSRDPKNHYQETTAKLKGMVTKFISIPEHYVPYCKERGLITPSEKIIVAKEDEESEEEDESEMVEDETIDDSDDGSGSDQEEGSDSV